jgi:hypothetical protein
VRHQGTVRRPETARGSAPPASEDELLVLNRVRPLVRHLASVRQPGTACRSVCRQTRPPSAVMRQRSAHQHQTRTSSLRYPSDLSAAGSRPRRQFYRAVQHNSNSGPTRGYSYRNSGKPFEFTPWQRCIITWPFFRDRGKTAASLYVITMISRASNVHASEADQYSRASPAGLRRHSPYLCSNDAVPPHHRAGYEHRCGCESEKGPHRLRRPVAQPRPDAARDPNPADTAEV